jgi:hypothetical protein
VYVCVNQSRYHDAAFSIRQDFGIIRNIPADSANVSVFYCKMHKLFGFRIDAAINQVFFHRPNLGYISRIFND